MENMPKTKKKKLSSDFSLRLNGGQGGRFKPKQDDSEWKFQKIRDTNLYYEMLCEPTNPDNVQKQRDNLSGNRLINQKKMDNHHKKIVSVLTICTGEGSKDEIIGGKRPGKIQLLY